MSRRPLQATLLLLLIELSRTVCAGPVVLDFEGLPDGSAVTNQYPNVTFANALVLTAGVSLNEAEFPPRSGTNVVSDDGGPIVLTFGTPITSFSGYFTYLSPLIVTGFDGAHAELMTASSLFSTNDALIGDPGSSPNELIAIASSVGFSEITIAGDPAGGSFAGDDFTFVSSVPEPRSFLLLIVSCLVFALRRKSPKQL